MAFMIGLETMRFSIRMLLLLTAYMALAAAAIGTQSYFLTDLVCAATILALVYVALLGIMGKGKGQAMALGFVLLSVVHIVGVYLFPDRVPSMRVFSAMGYSVTNTGRVFESDLNGNLVRASIITGPVVRTAHAVSTMFAGFVGCLIGAMAYHQSGNTQSAKPK